MTTSETIEDLLLRWQDQRRHDPRPSVAALCAERPELAPELERRIAAFESMEALLHIAQPATVADGATGTGVPAHLVEKLRPLGYELHALIDQGGMGVVYRATQVELGRMVALKMIAGLRASPKQLARFQVEVEAVAKLHHPNVVQIFDCGEVDGHWFFSMEYVAGGTLAHLLAAEPFAPAPAAELVETLARAMHHAHLRGVVHRDLKPANILITTVEGDPRPVPKVSDFGLAKHLDSDRDHTATGEVLGTPSYMAPEQAEGNTDAIGPVSDVYALGVILYQSLTGQPPFQGKTVLETLRRVVYEDPVPPSRLQRHVPRDLEAICLKCLEKRPERRYATADALAEDLQRFLTGRPVVARPVTAVGRAAKWCRRRPVWAALVLLIALAPVAFAGWDHWQQAQERTRSREMEELHRQRIATRAVEVAPQAREILNRHCLDCHGPQLAERGFRVDERASLLDADRRNVVLAQPEASRLILRIVDGSMPPPEEELHRPRVSSLELSILRDWIAGGAPEFPVEDPAAPTPPVVPRSELAARAKAIFIEHCYACHRYPEKEVRDGKVIKKEAKGGIPIMDHEMLVTKRKVVVPGEPERSELYRLLVTADDKKLMPPPTEAPMTAEEIETVRKWIEDGAPPFPRTHPAKKE